MNSSHNVTLLVSSGLRLQLAPLTDTRAVVCPGPGLGVQTQTDGNGHAGDLLPSSPTVLVKDVDLFGFKGQAGLNLHHTARPGATP